MEQGQRAHVQVVDALGESVGVGLVYVPHYNEVQPAVAVVVAPGAAHGAVGAVGVGQPGGLGNVGEDPFFNSLSLRERVKVRASLGHGAIVAEQFARAPVGDEQVLVSVVVIVGGAASVPSALGVCHSGLRRHVGKGAVAVVAEQRVLVVPLGSQAGYVGSGGDVSVLPAVAVVVEHHHARAEGDDVQQAAVVGEGHSRLLADFLEHRRLIGQGIRQRHGRTIGIGYHRVHRAGSMGRSEGNEPVRAEEGPGRFHAIQGDARAVHETTAVNRDQHLAVRSHDGRFDAVNPQLARFNQRLLLNRRPSGH